MLLALRILLVILGISAVAICLSILVLGPSATASFTEAQFNMMIGSAHPLTGPWPPTMDSELRFYAPFWGVYGLVLLAVARELPARLRTVPPLAALFFAGGIGRAISYVAVGAPHPAFTLLMGIELVAPLVFLALWWGANRRITRLFS